MTKITNLQEYKESRKPHISGEAKCLNCQHTWIAVSPENEIALTCPACGLNRGVYNGNYAPDIEEPVATCRCNNQLFYITQYGAFCIKCGSTHDIRPRN